MSELKPCPFCGKEPSTYEDTGYVYCPNDDCMVADSYWEKAILPVEKWNTRPIEDALNARIAELEAAQRWIPDEGASYTLIGRSVGINRKFIGKFVRAQGWA